MLKQKLGLIGAGKMGEALLRCILKAGLVKPESLFISDISKERCKALEKELRVKVARDNLEVAQRSEVILLAVKPNEVGEVLRQIKEDVRPERHLLISIAAGITTTFLEGCLKEGSRVIRVMPNAACMVGEAATGYSPGKNATTQDRELAGKILDSMGRSFLLEERHLDAVTGLSGSGPAYAAVIIEALSDGGVKMGLPRDVSTKLAAQTLLGTAKMVLEGSYQTTQIKEIVTSPGGTTIEGLHAIEKGSLRACLIEAVEAATLKSRSLGEKSAKK
jgi:pyrroline-5-carboxylate reductase